MKLTKKVWAQRYRFDARGRGGYQDVQVQHPTALGYAAIGLASIPVLVGVFGDGFMDITGDMDTSKPVQIADPEAAALESATEIYGSTYERASPAGRFALQYLTDTNVVVDLRIHESNNGNGIAGFLTGGDEETEDYETTFNNGCLNKTSYDIDGGDITGTISGVFTSGTMEGEMPTAAASAFVDSSDPDILIVSSGHTNSRDLRFRGLIEGSSLSPADQQTKDVLSTYGCSTGVQQGPTAVDGFTTGSSPWVVQ